MTDDKSTALQLDNQVINDFLMRLVKEQRAKRRWGILFKLAILAYFIFLAAVLVSDNENAANPSLATPHTALINIQGAIGSQEEANADAIVAGLRAAFENEQVKGIVLRINSPGGSPVHAGYVYDEIARLRAMDPEKKVYAVIMDVGASAAYYIASAADFIYANQASLVGSIGVILPSMGFTEAAQKFGVEQRTITAGTNKLFLDPLSPVNDEQVAFAEAMLANVHEQFIDAVKEGRGDRLTSDNPDIFSGLIWTGEQSLSLGLVDGLGSAGFVAREIIGEAQLVSYDQKPGLLEQIQGRFKLALNQSIGSWLSPSFKVQ